MIYLPQSSEVIHIVQACLLALGSIYLRLITGRYASPRIIENADRVIEMKAVKHYYKKSVKAIVGIEK